MSNMTAKTILTHSLRIAWKDSMELIRNKPGLLMLIIMPILMMALVGYMYPSNGSTDMSSVRIAIVNQDSGINGNQSISQTFITTLSAINNASTKMIFSNISSYSELNETIQRGDIDGGIIIPSDFSNCVINGTQANITIVTDESNPTISSTIKSVFSTMIDKIGATSGPFGVVTSTSSNYFNYVAPGIMMMTVMMSVMTGLPVAISQEREVGTMDGMMVAPIKRSSIILGKAIAQIARGLIQGVIVLALAVGLFGVTIQGSILLVFGLLLLGIFSFVGLGIAVTSLTKDQETASMVMMTLMFPMMFLSGIFFPIQQMPWFMQSISKFLPLTYASDALRKVMVLGAGIPAISTDLIVLIVFGAIMIAIAVPVFRRMMAR